MKMKVETPSSYKLVQDFKETETEYIITIKVKLPKTEKQNPHIKRMLKKQESVAVTILRESEREARKEYKEGKRKTELYTENIFK